ncbi:hypothetical protein FH972_026517 [Carpinus fangiana]|uniref:Uncharacterized protein n=1 Tax=Carpinus fangiana TaxID=176857 RepID=A0A5N6L481_9ROSI|nr:hypothetical protein FH972_026517 [Carpinus fangiana]
MFRLTLLVTVVVAILTGMATAFPLGAPAVNASAIEVIDLASHVTNGTVPAKDIVGDASAPRSTAAHLIEMVEEVLNSTDWASFIHDAPHAPTTPRPVKGFPINPLAFHTPIATVPKATEAPSVKKLPEGAAKLREYWASLKKAHHKGTAGAKAPPLSTLRDRGTGSDLKEMFIEYVKDFLASHLDD